MSIPAHLFRRNGVFYFRWAIPPRIRALLQSRGRWEVRVSLRSFERRIAIPAAFHLWQRALVLADNVMAAGKPVGYTDFMSQLIPQPSNAVGTDMPAGQPEPLADILGTYDVPTLQTAIAALQNQNAPVFDPIRGCDVTYYNRVDTGPDEFHYDRDEVETNYYDSNAQLLPETVTSVIGEQGKTFFVSEFLAPRLGPKGAEPRYQLAVPTKPVQCSIAAIRAYRRDALAIRSLIAPATLVANVGKHGDHLIERISLSDAMSRWIQFHTDQGRDSAWSPHTANENEYCARLLIDIVGDKQTRDVTPGDADDFRTVLATLPPRFRVLPKYSGLEPREVSRQNKVQGGPVLSPRTMEKYVERCQSFMQFCFERGYSTIQPFTKLAKQLSIAAKRRQAHAEPRLPFDENDLKLMFESDEAIKAFRRQKQASRLWVPMLALYTGARLSELTELRATQVTKRNGLVYIDFREWDPKQRRLKSNAASREVPVHGVLIKSGFLAYADSKRHADDPLAPLFPDLDGDHKEGNPPISRFFNETLLTAIGIKTKQKVFHSFRHTVSDKLKRANVVDVKISAYMGHATDGKEEWKTTYGTGLKAHDLTELLPYLDYPIDWSKFDALLRQKQFIG